MAAGVLVALTLGACGGGSGGDPQATSAERRQDAELKFARCMRQHGIDMPDPAPGGGIRLQATPKTAAKMESAQRACNRYLEAVAPKLTPAQVAEIRDQALKFSRCMRQHGIDMPDPQVSSNGGIGIRVRKGGPGKAGLSPDSPAFNDAQEACKSYMPEGPKPR
jgi:hypothetical protein